MIVAVLAFADLTGPVPKAGIIVLALLAATTLLARAPRLRAAAMLGALVLSPMLLLADIWNSSQLRFVHHHPLPSAVAAIVALVVLAAVAVALARRPAVFGFLAVLALPFRIPVTVSGNTSNLLVPLYFVVAAGALAWLVPVLRHPQQAIRPRSRREEPAAREARIERSLHAPAPDPPLVRWVALGLSAMVVLYAIQAIYSSDFQTALQNMVFFYGPFALLFQLLRQEEWTLGRLRAALTLSIGLALIFAVIGFAEYATKRTFFNSALEASNNVHSYFVINSIFYDPNIFGRYLALVMILAAVSLLYRRRRRAFVGIDEQVWIVAALAVLWACLVLTLSRSSIGALLVGLAVLAALRWRPSRALYVALGVIVLGVIIVVITPHTFGIEQGFNGFSGGRGGLIGGGAKLFADRPGWGFGSGSFVTEYRRHHHHATTLAASHTIPVTIAAEQGVIGLIVYVGLVVSALVLLLRGARQDPVRSAVAAAFAALLFHTMFYADFLEDPTTWALLGIGAALGAAASRTTAAQRAAARRRAVTAPAAAGAGGTGNPASAGGEVQPAA
jgi:putative inorganic carbon (HCO3(-)) transporter